VPGVAGVGDEELVLDFAGVLDDSEEPFEDPFEEPVDEDASDPADDDPVAPVELAWRLSLR
jgi:hypothetical protein